LSAEWTAVAEPDTRVPLDTLNDVNAQLIATPAGFTVNRKLQRLLERRLKTFQDGGPIDWAHAEALALGTLLTDGIPLRSSFTTHPFPNTEPWGSNTDTASLHRSVW
jgi:2-oxoglutarate dehydrogenase complex dehydrogenase (E1) component-like enzyme